MDGQDRRTDFFVPSFLRVFVIRIRFQPRGHTIAFTIWRTNAESNLPQSFGDRLNDGIGSGGGGVACTLRPRISPEDRFVLHHLAIQALRPGGIVIERWELLGNGSTQAFLDVPVQQGTLYCVDTSRRQRERRLASATRPRLRPLRHLWQRMAQANGTALVKPMLMNSGDAASVLADGIADLVFIDADHTYQAVKRDIQMWASKVRRGGFLCGHDCEGSVAELGADLVDAHLEEDFVPLEKHLFGGFHPGPVKAVEELGATVNRWAHRRPGRARLRQPAFHDLAHADTLKSRCANRRPRRVGRVTTHHRPGDWPFPAGPQSTSPALAAVHFGT